MNAARQRYVSPAFVRPSTNVFAIKFDTLATPATQPQAPPAAGAGADGTSHSQLLKRCQCTKCHAVLVKRFWSTFVCFVSSLLSIYLITSLSLFLYL